MNTKGYAVVDSKTGVQKTATDFATAAAFAQYMNSLAGFERWTVVSP